MDFVPFDPPPTDHDSLATGYTTEKGVNAKTFVEGINAYLAHLFSVVNGSVPKMIQSGKADLSAFRQNTGAMVMSAEPDLVKLFAGLSDRMAKMEQDHAMLEAMLTAAPSTPQAATIAQAMKQEAAALEDKAKAAYMAEADALAKANPHVETASEAVQRIHNDLAAALAKAKAEVGTAVADVEAELPRNTLADVLAGISR